MLCQQFHFHAVFHLIAMQGSASQPIHLAARFIHSRMVRTDWMCHLWASTKQISQQTRAGAWNACIAVQERSWVKAMRLMSESFAAPCSTATSYNCWRPACCMQTREHFPPFFNCLALLRNSLCMPCSSLAFAWMIAERSEKAPSSQISLNCHRVFANEVLCSCGSTVLSKAHLRQLKYSQCLPVSRVPSFWPSLANTRFLVCRHPGNLLRTPEGKICILDFGLMTEVRCPRWHNRFWGSAVMKIYFISKEGLCSRPAFCPFFACYKPTSIMFRA